MPYTGTIQALAINANGDVFAWTEAGGIFRSNDNGESWIPEWQKIFRLEGIK